MPTGPKVVALKNDESQGLLGVHGDIGELDAYPGPFIDRPQGPGSPLLVKAANPFRENGNEASVVFFEGKTYVISFPKEDSRGHMPRHIKVMDYQSNTTISSTLWPDAFGSAFVSNGRVWVFGSDGDKIQMTSTNDFFHWDPMTTVMAAPANTQFFNTSITKGPEGYVMTYEVDEPGQSYFTFRVAKSVDLLNWTTVGRKFSNGGFACPTIRYVDGMYYIVGLDGSAGLSNGGGHITHIARTVDFETYETSVQAVLTPDAGEGSNASDLDFTDTDHGMVAVYMDGDQQNWAHLRVATYSGTVAQFLKSFF